MKGLPVHLLLCSLWLLTVGPAQAAKVTLAPENWGLPAGEECVSCHRKSSRGLTTQWEKSAHAEAGVNCLDCHQAAAGDVDSIEHEGQVIAVIVSPRDCGRCHETEYRQQQASVHSNGLARLEKRLPALHDGIAGGCAQCHGSRVEVRGDGTLDPATWPNTGIGRINPDGSTGSCAACHGRHHFDKAEARDPAGCVRCHTGAESPDDEIFRTSKHGLSYALHRADMNLHGDTWRAGEDYAAAPTCATCHMGAAGKLPASHNVGMRETWQLDTPVAEQQYLVVFSDGSSLELPLSASPPRRGADFTKPDGSTAKVKAVAHPKRRRQAMMRVCVECHGKPLVENYFRQFDDVMQLYNDKFAKPAQALMAALYDRGKLTPAPFDEPLEFTYRQLWHGLGGRLRHGAAMMNPAAADTQAVAQWFYSRFLPQVRALTDDAFIRQYTNGEMPGYELKIMDDEDSSAKGGEAGNE